MKNVRLNYRGKMLFFTGVKSVQFVEVEDEMSIIIYAKNDGITDCFTYPLVEVDYLETYEGTTHTMQELLPLIQQWFIDREIDEGNGDGQIEKLQEEVEELVDAHEYGDSFEVRDAIGDIMVVLIGYCLQTGLDIVHCLDGAYNEIKDRTGKVNKNGVFVKDE
jgi:hypothetical protein